MCAGGAIVFLNSSMSLPASCSSTECSFLPQHDRLGGSSISIRNGPRPHRRAQQHPGGTADNLQLQNEAGLSPKCTLWKWLEGAKKKKRGSIWCFLHQAELNTDGCASVVIWVNGWVKLEFGWSSCCDTDMIWKLKKAEWLFLPLVLLNPQLSGASACIWCLTVTSWVVSSSAQRTIWSRSEAARAAGALSLLRSF